jgi:hypothetical protein
MKMSQSKFFLRFQRLGTITIQQLFLGEPEIAKLDFLRKTCGELHI